MSADLAEHELPFLAKWPKWLRWLLFLPLGIISGMLGSAFIHLTQWFMGFGSETPYVVFLSNGAFGYVFLYVSSIMAPKNHFTVSIILFALSCILYGISFLSILNGNYAVSIIVDSLGLIGALLGSGIVVYSLKESE